MWLLNTLGSLVDKITGKSEKQRVEFRNQLSFVLNDSFCADSENDGAWESMKFYDSFYDFLWAQAADWSSDIDESIIQHFESIEQDQRLAEIMSHFAVLIHPSKLSEFQDIWYDQNAYQEVMSLLHQYCKKYISKVFISWKGEQMVDVSDDDRVKIFWHLIKYCRKDHPDSLDSKADFLRIITNLIEEGAIFYSDYDALPNFHLTNPEKEEARWRALHKLYWLDKFDNMSHEDMIAYIKEKLS